MTRDFILTPNVFVSRRNHAREKRLKRQIHFAQIQALYRQMPMVLSVDVVNAGLVGVVLSSHAVPSRWIIFVALTVLLAAMRAVLWHLNRARRISNSAAIWAICATIGSGLSGFLWGVGGALLLSNDLIEQTFFAFMIGGMCAAPLVSFSYYLPAFLAYAIPATLPLVGRFVLNGWTINAAMGDMILVFAAAITLAAYNSSRAFTNLLSLNFDLAERTEQLSGANLLLETEVAQRKIAQSQLHQAQKMEAIGQLTGGIAHDFNNLLTGVIGHLDLACRRAIDDSGMCALLRAARNSAERGAKLTRQLLAFARRQHLDPKPVDLCAILESVKEMLQRTIGPNIRLSTRAEADVPRAWVDPNQLELAILNLALNARDAMPNGGVLAIGAEDGRGRIEGCTSELTANDYVIVSVKDTGAGMSDETLARAFEPFFTTKDAGCGSGLGLSMVHGFAAQSGGSVQITSILQGGTTVDLWLPRVKDETLVYDSVELDASITDPGQARILVCDDDDDVRTFVVNALREGGFSVWEASSGSSALDILQRERPIDLLLVDYAMPEMNGTAVIARARAYLPGLKVVLMTGYAEILRAGTVGGVPLLEKPFDVADLEKRVREMLAATLPEVTNAGISYAT